MSGFIDRVHAEALDMLCDDCPERIIALGIAAQRAEVLARVPIEHRETYGKAIDVFQLSKAVGTAALVESVGCPGKVLCPNNDCVEPNCGAERSIDLRHEFTVHPPMPTIES